MAEENIVITELEPEEIEAQLLQAKEVAAAIGATKDIADDPTISPGAKAVGAITAVGMAVGSSLYIAAIPPNEAEMTTPTPTVVTEEYIPNRSLQTEEYSPKVALTDEERDIVEAEPEIKVVEKPKVIEETKVTEEPKVVKRKETITEKVKRYFKPKPKEKKVVKRKDKEPAPKKYAEPKEKSYTVSKKYKTLYYKKPMSWSRMQSIKYGWDGGTIITEGGGADFGRKKDL